MKSVMSKTTMREIRQSLGRYFAILAIVALGVAIFSGLKVTKSVMVRSADAYLEEKQFYDLRLLSTLGFEEEDVETLAAKEDVRAAEGALSADILCVNGEGNEIVVKAHSLMDGINGVEVTAGRLPEADDECVVDSILFGEEAIGGKIVLADSNDTEDLDNFTYTEYTITGIVQSSYYIQFERGNSSMGNGRVSGFIYLLPGGFSMDYYTEIFVKFDEDYTIYSDEYDAYIEEKESLWETYCEEQGDRRYRAIVSEAEAGLADAEAELADAQQELADAQTELEEERTKALEELEEARQELLRAEQEIADGEEQLADGEQEIADAEATIAGKEQELLTAEQEIADNEALLAEKRQEYEDGMAQFESGKKQVQDSKNALESAEKQIAEGDGEVAAAQAQIDAMAGLYPEEAVAAAQAQLDEQKAALEASRAQVQAGWSQVRAAEAQLNSAYMELAAGGVQLETAEAELADAKTQLADGKNQLAEAKQELADAKAEFTDSRQKMADAKEEVADGWVEYEDGYAEFEAEIADAEAEIEDAKAELADAEAELADARAEIEDIERPDTYVLGRDTNIGYVCFESDSSIVEGIAMVFPAFFFLVAALVCTTTMNRMVEEQRTQIGVLKALGYSEGSIMGKYLFYSGSAALIGCVGGFLGGTYFIPYVIWIAYGMMYSMGDMLYVFDWQLAVISLVCSLLCSMGATWFSCRQELKEAAAGLMRPKAPKAGKRVFLERVPLIWNRLKFLDKVSVRNVIRYKKRFFMMVMGISGCTALLVTGFGVRDSVTNIANQQFEEIHVYDMNITLQDGHAGTPDSATQELLDVVEGYDGQYLFALEDTLDMVCGGEVKSVNLIVADEPERLPDFISLHTASGEAVAYPGEGEVVICEKLSEICGIGIGDAVVLRDDTGKEFTASVSGICENYIYNYIYLNAETYGEAMGETVYKNLYVNLPEETDPHLVSAEAMRFDNVTSVTVNEDMLVRFSSMMGSMDYIVFVIIVFAAALAFIVLYNLNNINITERVREIATIKVLGFYKKETTSYVFRENMVLTGIGCALGLFLGRLLHLYVMHEVDIDMISFDVQVANVSYLFSVILTFVFNWIVNRLMTGKLDKINMAESLKSVD